MPGGAKPKRRAYYFEVDFQDFIRKQAGIPATRVWGSGAGRPNPAIDVEVSSKHFPNRWQVKERANLPEWLFGSLAKVSAVAVRQPRGKWYVVMEVQDLIEYCGLPKEG